MKRASLIAAAFLMLALPAFAAQEAAPAPDKSQDRFTQMQSMMEQARKAGTPAERQKLMQDHMKVMQEQMSAMHGMMGGKGMMGGMMNGAGQGKGQGTDQSGQMPMQMMQQRMDQMQQMMEQMLGQHEMMMKPQP